MYKALESYGVHVNPKGIPLAVVNKRVDSDFESHLYECSQLYRYFRKIRKIENFTLTSPKPINPLDLINAEIKLFPENRNYWFKKDVPFSSVVAEVDGFSSISLYLHWLAEHGELYATMVHYNNELLGIALFVPYKNQLYWILSWRSHTQLAKEMRIGHALLCVALEGVYNEGYDALNLGINDSKYKEMWKPEIEYWPGLELIDGVRSQVISKYIDCVVKHPVFCNVKTEIGVRNA